MMSRNVVVLAQLLVQIIVGNGVRDPEARRLPRAQPWRTPPE